MDEINVFSTEITGVRQILLYFLPLTNFCKQNMPRVCGGILVRNKDYLSLRRILLPADRDSGAKLVDDIERNDRQ